MKKRKIQASQPYKQKKKPRRSESSSNTPDVKDSKSAREQAEPYRLATVKFPIDALSPIWTLGTNRPIDEAHKRTLVQLFKSHGLHRSDVSNRVLVACDREDFDKMQSAMALMGPDNGFSAAVGDVESVWPYFKNWMPVVGKQAELMAGNHRIEALKEVLSTLENGGGEDERWWLCDLYDKGTLPSLLSVKLRANREDVLLPDTHGQIWAELTTLASTNDTLFCGNSRELETEMATTLGLVGRTRFPTKRLVTLWRNKNWRRMITDLCCFPVGQELFSISAFEWMASCRIDDFWFSFFKKAISSAARVRQSYGIEIERQDWIQLATLSETSSHDHIMVLFYPELVGDPYTSEVGPRRHNFLIALDDEQYKDLYHHILTRPDLRFPDVHLLMRTTKREGKVMHTVMAHIGYWLSNTPAVVQDRNAVKPLLRTAFIPALHKRHGSNANQKSIELEYQVLTYVRQQLNAITDRTVEHYLDILPTSTEHDYNKRFDNNTWKHILILVHDMVGPHFESQVMTRFNREDPKTIKTTPLTTILHSICDTIGNDPELARSSVLGEKNAVQSLKDALRPIVARWALEQYDKAVEHARDPAGLAQVREEREKCAALHDTEVGLTNSPTSSYGGDSIDFLSEECDMPMPGAIAPNDVHEIAPLGQGETGGSAPKRMSSDIVASMEQSFHLARNGCDATEKVTPAKSKKNAPVWERDIEAMEIRHSSGLVRPRTLSEKQPRGPESARKGWRMRPVAQASIQPQP